MTDQPTTPEAALARLLHASDYGCSGAPERRWCDEGWPIGPADAILAALRDSGWTLVEAQDRPNIDWKLGYAAAIAAEHARILAALDELPEPTLGLKGGVNRAAVRAIVAAEGEG